MKISKKYAKVKKLMSILDIKKEKDPILRKKAEGVKDFNDQIRTLISDMKETMDKNKGVGLAAPQVGISKRIIVVNTPEGVMGFVNPKITKMGERTSFEEEGCLSLPGLYLKIKRAGEVEIETLDESGKKIKIQVKDIVARIFQHEVDHLNGILIVDRYGKFNLVLEKIKNFLKN